MASQPVIYLTGAPATGKTAVANFLVSRCAARRFSYSSALRELPELQGVSHQSLRALSAEIIDRHLIQKIDRELPSLMEAWRRKQPVVIDSHAVTNERWGLRAIPYSPEVLAALGLSHVVCLMCDAATIAARIDASPEGRQPSSLGKLEQLNNAQLTLALVYGHSIGVPVSMIDANQPLGIVCEAVANSCGLAPSVSPPDG
jgi:adenylate kinase